MEIIIIKHVREPYEKDEDIWKLLCYIAGECDSKKEHTRYYYGEGVSLKPEKAARQMILVQKSYKKVARKSGKRANRWIYHYMVSFPPSMDDANCAKLAAAEIADIFRRTFATNMYDAGARVEEIAAYIGDLESTTRRYYIAIRKKVSVEGVEKQIVPLPDSIKEKK